MFINTSQRTNASEIMDDFSMEGENLRDALDKIAKINQLLGGNKLTLQGVKCLISKEFSNEELVIVDIGSRQVDAVALKTKTQKENQSQR